VSYDGAGNQIAVKAPNGTVQTWGYDGAGRPVTTSIVLGGTILFSQTDTLDAAGQRVAIDDSWGHSAFTYDPAGRLSSAAYPDGGSEADQYDAVGNRTLITSTTLLQTGLPTGSVTPTSSPSASPTASGTAVVTATATVSATATLTPDSTPSDTATTAVTGTVTVTGTATVTATATLASSITPTATSVVTGTATPTTTTTAVTGTATPSATVTVSPTPSATPGGTGAYTTTVTANQYDAADEVTGSTAQTVGVQGPPQPTTYTYSLSQ